MENIVVTCSQATKTTTISLESCINPVTLVVHIVSLYSILTSVLNRDIIFLGWSLVSRELRANEAEGGWYTAILHIT